MSAPVTVCVLSPPAPNAARGVACAGYIHEILGHAGLCYDTIEEGDLAEVLPSIRLLVTVGDGDLPPAARAALPAWVDSGGAWLAVGGACGLPDVLGVTPEAPAYATFGGGRCLLGEGYLRVDHPLHPVLEGIPVPLHFFGGTAFHLGDGTGIAGVLDAHQRSTHRAGIVESARGRGRCLFVAADVTGTVVRIQQGIAITRDGISSPDGLAPVSDGVLKSDDGAVLDWDFDRRPVPGAPGLAAFLHPVADIWRELILRAIFHLATQRRIAVPLLWLYPRGLPALAHMSHDSDQNDPILAERLLDVLEEAEIHSTWCVILPGYDARLLGRIRDAGHELATHFDAMSEGTEFTEEQFDVQWRTLTEMFCEAPVTNKNHYLRWEGDTEFFTWLERCGIQMDQSKGASKTGEAGFNFGTCHPYFPMDPAGTLLDVLELSTPTQDLVIFAPACVTGPLLDAVERRHGVLHMLFHPAHIAKDGVSEALLAAVRAARERGMEWWTARRLNAWERARRSARWTAYEITETGARATLMVADALPGATVLWLAPHGARIRLEGRETQAETVERWGFAFRSVVMDAVGEVTIEAGSAE
jgi:peptidoglycan/xylan/chitin deacetylase (PgdA/CDA1 family)